MTEGDKKKPQIITDEWISDQIKDIVNEYDSNMLSAFRREIKELLSEVKRKIRLLRGRAGNIASMIRATVRNELSLLLYDKYCTLMKEQGTNCYDLNRYKGAVSRGGTPAIRFLELWKREILPGDTVQCTEDERGEIVKSITGGSAICVEGIGSADFRVDIYELVEKSKTGMEFRERLREWAESGY